MMNSQFEFDAARPASFSLGWRRVLRIAGVAGFLTVHAGRVWLTRQDDPDDHVLQAGERFMLRATDVAVIEPWCRDEPVRLAWQPLDQPLRAGLPREPAAERSGA
jgi:hypothetical protein